MVSFRDLIFSTIVTPRLEIKGIEIIGLPHSTTLTNKACSSHDTVTLFSIVLASGPVPIVNQIICIPDFEKLGAINFYIVQFCTSIFQSMDKNTQSSPSTPSSSYSFRSSFCASLPLPILIPPDVTMLLVLGSSQDKIFQQCSLIFSSPATGFEPAPAPPSRSARCN